MAVITPTTFDPLDAYTRVRLGQGVPIVDADVNEREDIAMFEQRAFLKWYVGDGVPDANDGFRIAESVASAANNFTIRSGTGVAPADALGNAGRCLVNGIDVMIPADLDFRDQPLHASKAGAAALSLKLGSPVIAAMAPAAAATTVFLWLDVWDVLWTANDDPTLLLPGLGVESCARMKRFWAVRARALATPPVAPDPDFAAGHAYYLLAAVTRRAADANVNAADIVDMREQRLLVPPSTLAMDLFNESMLDYRRGLRRPPISFRQAINALIRGQIPATAETVIASAPAANDGLGDAVFFQGGSAVVMWTSDRIAGTNQVFATSLDLAAPEASAPAAVLLQVTSGAVPHALPHGAPLRDGRVVMAYEEVVTPLNRDIMLKVAPLAGLPAAVPKPVTVTAANERAPFVVPVGALGAEQVNVMWKDEAAQKWRLRRYDTLLDNFNVAADLSATLTLDADLHAAKDGADNTWVAFVARTVLPPVDMIEVVQITNAAVVTPETTLSTLGVDNNPFVLVDPAGAPWVFWVSTAGGVSTIQYARRTGAGAWLGPFAIPGAPAGPVNHAPSAVVDADGGIWVFWDSQLAGGSNKDIWYARHDPVSNIWTPMRPTTGSADQDLNAITLTRGDGIIWLFWNRVLPPVPPGRTELFFRRLVTTV
jgi:hypothetical protein